MSCADCRDECIVQEKGVESTKWEGMRFGCNGHRVMVVLSTIQL